MTMKARFTPLTAGLWLAQLLLASFFLFAGYTKLATPAATLAAMIPWTAEYPALRIITALVDLAGGLGIILPTITGITPILTVRAAQGLVALQILAIGFHLSRGEAAAIPINLVILPLVLFVLWGRSRQFARTETAT